MIMIECIKFWLLFLFLFLISGCSGGLKSSDIQSMRYGDSLDEIEVFKQEWDAYRLDYLVDSKVYRYQTHYVGDTGEYYGFLFEDGLLIGVSRISQRIAFWPRARNCALFPPNFNVDVNTCLREFNDDVIKNSISLSGENISTVNKEVIDRRRQELTGTLVEMAILSPLIAPAAVVYLPLHAMSQLDSDNKKASFAVKLGANYADLLPYISALPEEAREFYEDSGSVYIRSGFGFPVVAFGVYEGRVVWIDMKPDGVCEGMPFNRKCRLL